jgi:hypothetical protein
MIVATEWPRRRSGGNEHGIRNAKVESTGLIESNGCDWTIVVVALMQLGSIMPLMICRSNARDVDEIKIEKF